MEQQAKETRVRRERQFGRVYDYETGAVKINAAFDTGFLLEAAINKIPGNILQGFALQSVADYIVGEANEVMRERLEGETDEAQRARALEVAQEAYMELCEGKVDFRTGAGLGGMRSAIGALGQVLFDLGKRFVKNQRGETLSFTDVHGAREAVKSLYLDTTPKGPFEPVIGKDGKPELDKDGNPKMRALASDSHLTGRMIFNAICETDTDENPVKRKLAELRVGAKKPAVVVEMG